MVDCPRRFARLEVVALSKDNARDVVASLLRDEWGRVFSIMVRQFRDWDVAEDALQDAVVAALQNWPVHGVPQQPVAWLLSAAKRKAIDAYRRTKNFERKLEQLGADMPETASEPVEDDVDDFIGDERLRLVFTCCHPALAEEARVALTLRTLGGLNTAEIARAFLLPEATMAQRLVRAKRKIRVAGIPYVVPDKSTWSDRLETVLRVVYFIFNEGYAATSGDLPTRTELCAEAIRLMRTLRTLTPEEPEVAGLLALMLLHDSRRESRVNEIGELLTLEHQDRKRWDREKIEEGRATLAACMALRQPGPYQIQAAISALHSEALHFDTTDWPQIVLLYARLAEFVPSDVVRLNWAIAVSFACGAAEALTLLEEIEQRGQLADYQPFFAAKADLLRRLGDNVNAQDAYRRAIAMTSNEAERDLLTRRRRELRGLH